MRQHATMFLPLLALFAGVDARAQTTWIVNPTGGGNFTDLQSAEAAASHGDTIVVQWGQFRTGVSGFATSKGITVVSSDDVFLATHLQAVRVANLPAGRTFRLVGFTAPRGQELRIEVDGCAGEVLLENLHALEPGLMFPTTPAIDVHNCASVTMRDVEDFGAPAVRVANSAVVLAACRLGLTSIGLAGGRCLVAIDSVVDVVEPHFATASGDPCIDVTRCDLRLAGGPQSLVEAGLLGFWSGTAIMTTLGTIARDPAVTVQSHPLGAPAIYGTAVVTVGPVPGTWATRAAPGHSAVLSTNVLANSGLWLFLGLPAPRWVSPFGPSLLDAQALALLSVQNTPVDTVLTAAFAIPAGFPVGIGFAAQPIVLGPNGLVLGVASGFAVH